MLQKMREMYSLKMDGIRSKCYDVPMKQIFKSYVYWTVHHCDS